ncbi:TfoX/Sxy family protein [uncultured Cellulomonas sp.]|uniref:TfoX/Sxy family protein n=1 Tax=uncultured Cellulomonas sp. TaxID=189682 RepID=UPI0026353431|nr:TfoX/Sxy family protein [uncultured Cellulomonas sp.]
MDPPQRTLAERVRAALPPGHAVREVAMFGGRAFMVDDAMVVSVGKDGDLLVRIDPARHEQLTARPGARPAVMGVDRPMGPGWITVAPSALDTDEELTSWLDVALEHHAAVSNGAPTRRAPGPAAGSGPGT